LRQRHHALHRAEAPGLLSVDEFAGEIHVAHLLHGKHALQVGAATHGAAVDFRHAEARAQAAGLVPGRQPDQPFGDALTAAENGDKARQAQDEIDVVGKG